jgi:hypothetical protein
VDNLRQCILHNDAIPCFAEQNADGRLIPIPAQLLVHRLQIKIELAGKLRLEVYGLELNDNIAMKFRMVKEKIEEEFPFAHLQLFLPSNKGETGAQFQQKFGDMVDQRRFQLPLVVVVGQRQKIKVVRIFDQLLRQSD